MTTVYGIADVKVIDDPAETKYSANGKAFLRLTFGDGTKPIDVSLNLAAMIGGVAKGVIERFGYE